MGIYLPNMEMPKSCGKCFVGNREICVNGCPLVPVPLHGDLIERDKLREKEFIHDGDAYAVVMSRDIRNAPTIIQASEEVYNEEVYDKYTDTAGNLHWTGTHSGEHIIQLKEGG